MGKTRIKEHTQPHLVYHYEGVDDRYPLVSFYCVWAPVASVSEAFKVDHNVCGNEIQRNEITKYFNMQLKKACLKEGLIFLSLYEKLVDENNKTITRYYSPDGIHLNFSAMEEARIQLQENDLL